MKYYVHTHTDDHGDHEVHAADCGLLPAPANFAPLGDFPSCEQAVAAARSIYRRCNGCAHCTPGCHAG